METQKKPLKQLPKASKNIQVIILYLPFEVEFTKKKINTPMPKLITLV